MQLIKPIKEEIIKASTGDYQCIRFTQSLNLATNKWSGVATFIKKAKNAFGMPGETVDVTISPLEWDAFWASYNDYEAIDTFIQNKLNK